MADAFDEFLNHSSRDNSGGNFLGNWKKRNPPQVDTWMHTAIAPKPVWRHQFYKVETREDRDTREVKRVVWSFNFNCHDPEDVVKKQYKTGDDGKRTVSPCKCPMCRMIDFVRGAVSDGRLSMLDPIFRFEGSEPSEAIELVAGGLFGGFPKKKGDFADDEADGVTWSQFRAAGLSLQGDSSGAVWKQQCMAKLAYVFAVVDNKDVSRGIQIAVEGALLGDKVKGVIADRRDTLGVEEGSFSKNPCAVRWYHKPDEDEFNKKYHAAPMGLNKIEFTDEIDELIRGNAKEVIARVEAQLVPGDVAMLRSLMERYAVVDLPFDSFFEGHDTTPKPKDSKEKGAKPAKDDDEDDEKPKAKKGAKPAPKKPVEPEFECGECGAAISATDTECPTCGADCSEDDDGEVKEDPPKPAPAKRAAAKPEPKPEAAPTGRRKLPF